MTIQVETYEELRQACVEELKRMASNLRVKGDFWRADKVEKFMKEYFGA